MRWPHLERHFPRLRGTPYSVTSCQDTRYNCVAWAAGDSRRAWWPRVGKGAVPGRSYHWPRPPEGETLDEFLTVFRSLGYETCVSRELEQGFCKVAIYVAHGNPSHVARQLPTGEWTSKLGDYEDITHVLQGLEDSDYGRVAVIMRRRL
jgi:hypothetical protein